MRNLIRLLALCSLIGAAFAAKGGPAAKRAAPARKADVAPFYWYYYAVDSSHQDGKEIGFYSKLRYAPDGKLKVGYRGHYDVRFAEFDGRNWQKQTIDTGAGSDAKIDMALDKDGNPHIIYHDWQYAYVYYVWSDGHDWHRSTLDTLGSGGGFYQLSAQMDANNVFHAIYTAKYQDYANLTYSYLPVGGERVGPTRPCDCGLSAKWNSITFDKNEKPVFGFFIHNGEYLNVTYMDGGQWKNQAVDTAGGTGKLPGFYASIAHDTGDSFYLSYQDNDKKGLYMAYGTPGGTWTVEKIDSMPSFTYFTTQSALVLGPDRTPYVVYPWVESSDALVATKAKLKLAYKKDGQWITQTVDSGEVVGEFPSIAISKDGLPAITYVDRKGLTLWSAMASKTAPPDTNNNGIPDYKEQPSGIKAIGRPGKILGGRHGKGAFFDSKGRTVAPKGQAASGAPAAGRSATGAYFQVEAGNAVSEPQAR